MGFGAYIFMGLITLSCVWVCVTAAMQASGVIRRHRAQQTRKARKP